jgi:succinoglycan biosynthesis transport protein ExoP
MKETEKSRGTIDYLSVFRRRLWWVVWPSLGIFLATTAVALLLPNIYQSEATILIEGQQVTQDLIPSTVTMYADQRIQSINQELMGRSKLLDLVQKFDLYPELKEKVSTDALIRKIEESIHLEPISAQVKTPRSNQPGLVTIAFSLSFEDKDPRKAQGVVNDLASFFLSKNVEARQASAKGTTDFLEKQVSKARERVAELDKNIAKFKEAHLEELPEFMKANMQKAERIADKTNNIEQEILVLKEQRTGVKYKLAFVDPYSGEGGRVLSDEEKLQQLEQEHAELKAKYSERHPKVRTLEKEIDMLKQTAKHPQSLNQKKDSLRELEQNLGELNSKYSDGHPLVQQTKVAIEELRKDIEQSERNGYDGTGADRIDVHDVTNPAYIALQSELDGINMRLNSLQNDKTRLLKQEEEIYAKLRSMPDVEKRYNELLLNQQNEKQHLVELQRKLEVAELAEGLEEGQLGDKFTITEPAFLPEEPYKPNRLAIILVGLILALGAGVGTGALREYSDHCIHEPEEVERLTGLDILSVIPYVKTPKERRKKTVKLVFILSGTVFILVCGIALFHYQVMDLYIFYDKLSRLLGDRLFVHF